MRRFWLRFILWSFIVPLLLVAFLLIRCVLDYLLRPEKVDYFGKFEAMVHDQYEPLEDNGFRDLVQTLGPHALLGESYVKRVAWQDIQTGERDGQQWWKEVWIPHCKAFQIDPNAEPKFLRYRPFDEFITTAGITGHEPPLSIRQAVCYAQAVAEYVDQMALAEARADEAEAADAADEDGTENEEVNETEWKEYAKRREAIWTKEVWDESDWDIFWNEDESGCYRGSYGPIYEDWWKFIMDRYPLYSTSPMWRCQTPDVRYPKLPLPKLTNGEALDYFFRLRQEPWTAVQNPQAAQWVIEMSPVFDTLSVAARKPHYLPYYVPYPLQEIRCPDLLLTQDLARQLEIRCCYRVGNGDIDGAIYDTMTLFHLARHLQQQPICVGPLVGVKIERKANEILRLIVHFGNPNSVQLAAFQSQLEALPPTPNLQRILLEEEYMALDCAQEVYFYSWERSAKHEPGTDFAAQFIFGGDASIEAIFNLFRPDLDTVCEIIHQHYAELQEIVRDTDIPRRNQRLYEFTERLNIVQPKGWQVIPYLFSLAISKQHRSEWMGNCAANILIPSCRSWIREIDVAQSQTDISRIGLAIERFRLAQLDAQTKTNQTSSNTNSNDAMESTPTESLAAQPSESSLAESSPVESLLPKTLDELVEAGFLDALPKDTFTQKNYVYQPGKYIPWQQEFEKMSEVKGVVLSINLIPTEYLLYGVGPNGIDDTLKWNASHEQTPPDMKQPSPGEVTCDDLRF